MWPRAKGSRISDARMPETIIPLEMESFYCGGIYKSGFPIKAFGNDRTDGEIAARCLLSRNRWKDKEKARMFFFFSLMKRSKNQDYTELAKNLSLTLKCFNSSRTPKTFFYALTSDFLNANSVMSEGKDFLD